MQNLFDSNTKEQVNLAINSDQLLEAWQGHRRLTRRVIEAFPELELLTFSIGGMRPFVRLATEMIDMAVPTLNGIVSGEWEFVGAADEEGDDHFAKTKADLLQLWDDTSAAIDTLWAQIPPHRFQQVESAFGMYEAPLFSIIQYNIDNEIHHRGQGYVYLRVLGIEPPAFPER